MTLRTWMMTQLAAGSLSCVEPTSDSLGVFIEIWGGATDAILEATGDDGNEQLNEIYVRGSISAGDRFGL